MNCASATRATKTARSEALGVGFCDDDQPPLKRPVPKVTRAPIVTRLMVCGSKRLRETMRLVRASDPNAVCHVVSLSFRIPQYGVDADGWIVPTMGDETSYDLHPPHECPQLELGRSEFLGFFFRGSSDDGVADDVASLLDNDPHAHVVIIDPSANGEPFARTVATVAAMRARSHAPFNRKPTKRAPIRHELCTRAVKLCETNTGVALRNSLRRLYDLSQVISATRVS